MVRFACCLLLAGCCAGFVSLSPECCRFRECAGLWQLSHIQSAPVLLSRVNGRLVAVVSGVAVGVVFESCSVPDFRSLAGIPAGKLKLAVCHAARSLALLLRSSRFA